MEDDPGSPPKRKGKGGRQRAPAPDASVDPKRARRIMANRASAAKSKEKQKRKVEVGSLPSAWTMCILRQSACACRHWGQHFIPV